MTKKEKNIKVAEACGIKAEKYFRKTVWCYGGQMHPSPPDYYGDLNDISKAVKTLGDINGDEYARYWNILRSLTGSAMHTTEASSAVRCEAFGYVKGLWPQLGFDHNA